MDSKNASLKIVNNNTSDFLYDDDEVSKFYRQGFENFGYVMMINPKGVISYMNPKFSNELGYLNSEIIGTKHPYFIMEELLSEFLNRKTDAKVEYKWKKKNGEDVWYCGQFLPVYNSRGDIQTIIEYSENNTFNRTKDHISKSVQKLQNSYYKFTDKKELFSHILKETLMLTNSHWSLLGEVKAKKDESHEIIFYHSESSHDDISLQQSDMNEVLKIFEPVLQDGRVLTVRKNKTVFRKLSTTETPDESVTFLAIPLYWEDHIIGVLGIANKNEGYKEKNYRHWKSLYDAISQLIISYNLFHNDQKLENEIKDHIILLEQSQEVAKIGGWTMDLETQSVYWSRQLYNILGCDASVFKPSAHSFSAFIEPNSVSILNNCILNLTNKLEPFDKVFQVDSNFGDDRWVRILGHPFDDNGKVQKVVGALQEVSELKSKEKEIEAHKAKIISNSKMASLGEMAGGIAHEINNPLTVIQGNAKQLVIALDKGTLNDELIRKVVEKITNTTQRIAKIIKGLKAFARDGGGDPFTDCSLKMIIEDTLSFCEARLRNHNVKLTISDVNDDLKVRCRPVQISQVLLNLIHNSEDEVRTKESPWINLDIQQDQDWTILRVTDSGTGIPPDIADKIMQPFFTTKETGKGTGLGLSIITGIIKSHEGIFYLDRESKNTSFVVKLPKKMSR